MNILITGVSGFVGKHLLKSLAEQNHSLRGAVRHQIELNGEIEQSRIEQGNDEKTNVEHIIVESIDGNTDWSEALDSIDVVIHLAACVHQLGDSASKAKEHFKKVNVEGTANLALQAAKAKVKHFIFLSSVKVYGDIYDAVYGKNASNNEIYTELSPTGIHCDHYGWSKLEAEKELIKIASHTDMAYSIIRSPLVYGPEVSANFKSLIMMAESSFPLPFLKVNNRRSMVAIDNLINFIQCCLTSEKAKNQLYLISDNDDLSLPRLIRLMRAALNKPENLFSFPMEIIKPIVKLLGKSEELGKLTGSLQVDISKAKQQLDWKPVITAEDNIIKTVHHYLELKNLELKKC